MLNSKDIFCIEKTPYGADIKLHVEDMKELEKVISKFKKALTGPTVSDFLYFCEGRYDEELLPNYLKFLDAGMTEDEERKVNELFANIKTHRSEGEDYVFSRVDFKYKTFLTKKVVEVQFKVEKASLELFCETVLKKSLNEVFPNFEALKHYLDQVSFNDNGILAAKFTDYIGVDA